MITFSEKFAVSPEIKKIQQALPEINKEIELNAAGMAFTFPQREVRILGDQTAQKAAAPRPGSSAETTQEEK